MGEGEKDKWRVRKGRVLANMCCRIIMGEKEGRGKGGCDCNIT